MKTCQHCQTELTNPRAKNCKTCSDILTDANRSGTYSFVMEAITTAKADGLTGSAMHETMLSAMKAGANKRTEWANEYRERQAERKAEESRRIQFYQEHGYWPGQDFEGEDARRDIEDARTFTPTRTIEDEKFG